MTSTETSTSLPFCPLCDKQFTMRSNIKRHIAEVHKNHPHKDEIIETWSNTRKIYCHQCSRKFPTLITYNKHIPKCNQKKSFKSEVFCWLCDDKTPISKKEITTHYADSHDVDMSVDKLKFDSLEGFDQWKRQMEKDTITRYIIDNKYRTNENSVQYFKCHRDGVFRSRAHKGRTTKHYKLNGHCPAKIRACQSLETGCVDVEFLGTHVGHDNNLDMIPRRQTNRYLFDPDAEEVDEPDSDEDFSEVATPVSEEVEIAQMKQRIVQMINHYFSMATTRDQFEIIENGVFSIGSVLEGEEVSAKSAKMVMGIVDKSERNKKLKLDEVHWVFVKFNK